MSTLDIMHFHLRFLSQTMQQVIFHFYAKRSGGASVSSPSRVPGSFNLSCEYVITTMASKDSQCVLKSQELVFVWSSTDVKRQQASADFPVKLKNCQPEVLTFINTLLCDPYVLQFDATIVADKVKTALEKLSGSISKGFIPGISIKVAVEESEYILGDTVIINTTPSVTPSMHIDSISYRVSPMSCFTFGIL